MIRKVDRSGAGDVIRADRDQRFEARGVLWSMRPGGESEGGNKPKWTNEYSARYWTHSPGRLFLWSKAKMPALLRLRGREDGIVLAGGPVAVEEEVGSGGRGGRERRPMMTKTNGKERRFVGSNGNPDLEDAQK